MTAQMVPPLIYEAMGLAHRKRSVLRLHQRRRSRPLNRPPKRDLPKRTGPFHYVRVIITPQQQPARRLDDTEYQLLTELV